MAATAEMRSQDAIAARIAYLQAEPSRDALGFRVEVLVVALDYEHAKRFLKATVTQEDWENDQDAPLRLTREAIEKTAGDYLEFAWGKAAGHRGISAERSTQKLHEFAWLLGRDDVVQAMKDAPYPQYGVPKLVAFAEGMGLPLCADEHDRELLDRMAQGLPCRDGCNEGCGN